MIDDEGTNRRVVMRGRNVWLPAWSPNHSRIVHIRSRRKGPAPGRVAVASRSGRNVEMLTGLGWLYPAWSPGGKWISASCSGACVAPTGLYLLDPDGSGRRRLTETGRANVSSWAPNGKRIVFTRGKEADVEVYVKTIGKKGVVRLTDNDVPEGWVSWSPGGELIAFTRPRAGHPYNPYDVWVMRSDGTGQRRVAKLPRTHDITVDWAPRAGRLLFSNDRGLFTMKPNGSDRQKLSGTRPGDLIGDW